MIRFGQVAKYIHKNSQFDMSLYRPLKKYDAVVFVKMMNPRCQSLARKLLDQGTKVIFDANINYYQIDGNYLIPGTKPSKEQQNWAIEMTRMVSGVVADSEYLADVCQEYNSNVTWIPDAVDVDLFKPKTNHVPYPRDKKLKLIWGGVGKKAVALELIEPLLIKFRDSLEVNIVTSPDESHNQWPPVLRRFKENGVGNIKFFKYEEYPEELRNSDVIISPRYLENAYEKAHTEYKITLGMSSGLPALASPQKAYLPILEKPGAGWICNDLKQWEEKLKFFIDHRDAIPQMGNEARRRVLEKYSISQVSAKYQNFIEKILNVN